MRGIAPSRVDWVGGVSDGARAHMHTARAGASEVMGVDERKRCRGERPLGVHTVHKPGPGPKRRMMDVFCRSYDEVKYCNYCGNPSE